MRLEVQICLARQNGCRRGCVRRLCTVGPSWPYDDGLFQTNKSVTALSDGGKGDQPERPAVKYHSIEEESVSINVSSVSTLRRSIRLGPSPHGLEPPLSQKVFETVSFLEERGLPPIST